MQNFNTLFNQILQIIPRNQFSKIIDKFQGDKYTKKLSSFGQLVILLYSQIAGKESLRDIETSLSLNNNKLYHLSVKTVKRSTLSDANNRRDYRIFEELFKIIYSKTLALTPKHKFKFKNPLFSIDATVIDVCLSIFPWAKFQKQRGAIKMHTKLNHSGNIPEFISITEGKGSDLVCARENFKFPPDSIIVMDKVYIDFKWFYSLDQQGVFFVTRAKNNQLYEVVGQQNFTEGKGVFADEKIKLSGRNPKKEYPKELRLIKYYDIKTNKVYTFITNNFKLAAKTIADIYKDRWQIELFFKWVKQNLKIKSFLGTSKNAILIQIWIAMIAYLIISYIKFQANYQHSILELTRRIREMLFERVLLIDILTLDFKDITKIPKFDDDFYQLKFALCLTGH